MDNSESKLRTGFFQRFQQTLFGVPRVLFCLEPNGLAVSILVRDRHSRPEGVLSRFLAQAFRIAAVSVVDQPSFLFMSKLKPPGKGENVEICDHGASQDSGGNETSQSRSPCFLAQVLNFMYRAMRVERPA